MADSRNLALQLLITAKDQASGILTDLKTRLAGLATAIAAAFSINEAAQFERALDAIRARADETGPALEALVQRAKDAAQTMGPEFGFSAAQAAAGIKELIAAGFSADESLLALKGTLALAAMEEISAAQAATLISDAIVQFGLSAGDASAVADILASSAGAVAATATDMAAALQYTGNAASQAGLTLTETSAVLDVLASAGIRGSEAGTGLASVLSILANPAHAATQALFDLGATSTNINDVLDFLKERGLNASQTIALFGEQAGRVINTLLAQGGTKAISDFADQIKNSGKSAEDTARIMQGNFLGAMDRFWESLKRVGTELATPKLGIFADGLNTVTNALNTLVSNDRIAEFQAALAAGFSALYDAAQRFVSQLDWSGIQSGAAGAFDALKDAAGRALAALETIYASLTGSMPGATGIAQQASEALRTAWDALGGVATAVADGFERIAETLGGPFAQGTESAKTAIAALTGETQVAENAYAALKSALDAGKVTQEDVAQAWQTLQAVIGSSRQQVADAQAAYEQAVAAQQAGTATQAQVSAAWDNLQTVIGSAQNQVDSARLAFDGLNNQFTTGKGLAEATAAAHDTLRSTMERVREGIETVTDRLAGQTSGLQALWAAMKDTAPEFLARTWDSLTQGAAALLDGVNRLAQYGAQLLADFIRAADFEPVRLLFEAVTSAMNSMVQTVLERFPAASVAGANLGNAFTVAWSGVVGLLAAVVSGTITVVEAIGQATFEVGKYFDRYSDEEISKIQANLNGLSDTASEFAAVAASSFEASGAAMDRMRDSSIDAAGKMGDLGAAGDAAARSHDAQAASAQTLADMQKALASDTGHATTAEEALDLATQAATLSADAQAASAQTLADMQKALASDTGHATTAEEALDLATQAATLSAGALENGQRQLSEAHGDAGAAATDSAENTLTLAQATEAARAKAQELTAEQERIPEAASQTQGAMEALGDVLSSVSVAMDAQSAASKETTLTLDEHRVKVEETRAALAALEEAQKNHTLAEIDGKDATAQLNAARAAAKDAIAVYQHAQDELIESEQTAQKVVESHSKAISEKNTVAIAEIDASIAVAEQYGQENLVAELTLQKKELLAQQAAAVAAAQQEEAVAAQAVANALQKKYEELVRLDPLNAKAIADAKAAAETAREEANSKLYAAQAADAHARQLEAESHQVQVATDAIRQLSDAEIHNAQVTQDAAATLALWGEETEAAGNAVSGALEGWAQRLSALSDAARTAFDGYADGTGQARDVTQELADAMAGLSAGGYVEWANQTAIKALEIEQRFNGQAQSAERLTERLQAMAQGGTVDMNALQLATAGLSGEFNLLDQQRLDTLQAAIDAASAKLREMKQETQDAKDRLSELNAELADAQGQDEKAQKLREQLDYQQRLAEIETSRAEAEAAGNLELVAILDQQKAILEQIHQQKLRNIEAEASAAQSTKETNDETERAVRNAREHADHAERLAGAMRDLARVDLSGLNTHFATLGSTVNTLRSAL